MYSRRLAIVLAIAIAVMSLSALSFASAFRSVNAQGHSSPVAPAISINELVRVG